MLSRTWSLGDYPTICQLECRLRAGRWRSFDIITIWLYGRGVQKSSRYRLTTYPAASRSQVSSVTPASRRTCLRNFSVGVLGMSLTNST